MNEKKHPGIVIRSYRMNDDGTRTEVPLPPVPSGPVPPRTGEHVQGTVEVWHAEEGWGVIASAKTPGGCWIHISDVVGSGFKQLTVGQNVDLEFEDLAAKYPGGNQDGYRYRAISAKGF
ncbi:cold shock domain-containing protein [Rhodococcus sp. P1Y]|uniref:cold shock domain-containing protein n=1 Tax=Rhodococcus sp. P1Y TaxID=1302308 RepID=UPI001F36674F|nr:cold shock domain-containing protein [Rhodococcus sp. P1Y]